MSFHFLFSFTWFWWPNRQSCISAKCCKPGDANILYNLLRLTGHRVLTMSILLIDILHNKVFHSYYEIFFQPVNVLMLWWRYWSLKNMDPCRWFLWLPEVHNALYCCSVLRVRLYSIYHCMMFWTYFLSADPVCFYNGAGTG